jgi:hypothetical protein
MVDPSLLYSEPALTWLQEDPAGRDGIIVPSAFMEWLRGEHPFPPSFLIADEDLEAFDQRRERLLSLLSDVPTFSYDEVSLEDEAQAVLREMFEAAREPSFLIQLRAEEWAFLQAHSFLASKLRRPLDAFRDAGSVILEFGQRMEDYLIRQVIPADAVPSVLTPGFRAKVGAKWIVVGGATIGGGTLGGVLGGLGGLAGSFTSGTLAKAAVVAIDP